MSDGARKRRQKRRTLPAMHAEQITPTTPITPITSIGQRPLVKVLTALAAWIAAVLLVAATFAAGPGQVQDSTEATPADAAITQRVENALAKDPFLRSQEIYVETQDGVVNLDRKSTRLNSSHGYISYAVFCLKKKKIKYTSTPRRTRTRQADVACRQLAAP